MTVTNGMSYHARDGKNANAAVAVSVTPADYGGGPLGGAAFQRELERRAYAAGGGGYRAPAQDIGHFFAGKAGIDAARVRPTYARGVTPCDFHELLPGFVSSMLETGLRAFGKKLPGFDAPGALLTGVETRTSSPGAHPARGGLPGAGGRGGLSLRGGRGLRGRHHERGGGRYPRGACRHGGIPAVRLGPAGQWQPPPHSIEW